MVNLVDLPANRLRLKSHDGRWRSLDERQIFYYLFYFSDPRDPMFDVDADDAQSAGWIGLFHVDKMHLPPSNLVGR